MQKSEFTVSISLQFVASSGESHASWTTGPVELGRTARRFVESLNSRLRAIEVVVTVGIAAVHRRADVAAHTFTGLGRRLRLAGMRVVMSGAAHLCQTQQHCQPGHLTW